MLTKRTPLYGIFICGVFLYIDQWLKWQSLHDWKSLRLVNDYFGWFPFLNRGVAFGLPLPMVAVIIVTVPILIALTALLVRSWRKGTREGLLSSIGLVCVITGSLSNLADRIIYRHTVDYILIFTGVINIADLLILTGFLFLFFTFKRRQPAA